MVGAVRRSGVDIASRLTVKTTCLNVTLFPRYYGITASGMGCPGLHGKSAGNTGQPATSRMITNEKVQMPSNAALRSSGSWVGVHHPRQALLIVGQRMIVESR